MSLRRRIGGVAAAALIALSSAGAALAWDTPKDGLRPVPALTSRVTDLTGTLSASERQSLESKLQDWEARTTNQLVVLMVPSTTPEAIEEYSLRVAEAWKIGQKSKDNGAIFLIAKDDKRMRIEVAYGFEGVLTDVTSRRIIGETVAPLFKEGKFAEGINAGVDRIVDVIGRGEPLPGTAKRTAPRHSFDYGNLFIILLVAVPIVGSILRSMFGNIGGSAIGGGLAGAVAWFLAGSLLIAGGVAVVAFAIIIFSMFGGGRGGGWIPGAGGGFGGGGGGGGGFSGGGGSFGGGGASGGW